MNILQKERRSQTRVATSPSTALAERRHHSVSVTDTSAPVVQLHSVQQRYRELLSALLDRFVSLASQLHAQVGLIEQMTAVEQ